mmetsp:Transcript_9555/g.18331  ORF Transcript_9555/g.18331 Transcript_9555/m.18331 type:complete len:156 (+) Transcript_9555:199-666(+)
MSSKPLSGINHKEYGVTSEGVCIFLDVALRNMGKDPTERPFTLKITGGTSGDVAGNAIKILNRDYGENAKIVGIVDHKGCCEDPSGLDLTELMRLVNNELSLEHFDESGHKHTPTQPNQSNPKPKPKPTPKPTETNRTNRTEQTPLKHHRRHHDG